MVNTVCLCIYGKHPTPSRAEQVEKPGIILSEIQDKQTRILWKFLAVF